MDACISAKAGRVRNSVLRNGQTNDNIGAVDLVDDIHADLGGERSKVRNTMTCMQRGEREREEEPHLNNHVKLLWIELLNEGRDSEWNLEVVRDAVVEHDKLAIRWPERDRLVQLEGVVAHALVKVDVLDGDAPVPCNAM